MTTFTSNGKRRLNSVSGIGHGAGGGNRVDPMINEKVPMSAGAKCVDCGAPIARTSAGRKATPRYCAECQPTELSPRTICADCGETLRERSASGRCGFCEAGVPS